MPEHVACTHLVQPAHLINFMHFLCGSHNSSATAAGGWNGCPREHRICQKYAAHEVEDEYHLILRCSPFEALRVFMHGQYNLFAWVAGIHRARKAGDEGMN